MATEKNEEKKTNNAKAESKEATNGGGNNTYNFHDNSSMNGDNADIHDFDHDNDNDENHDNGIAGDNAHDNIILTLTGDKITPEQIESLANWMKKERKEKKITQKDMAKKTGIDLKYYQKIESPNIPIQPNMTTLNKIVKGLGYQGIDISAKSKPRSVSTAKASAK